MSCIGASSGGGGEDWSPAKAFADKALQNSLDSKVDKREFKEITALKADKLDNENMISGIVTLNKQVQSVIMILSESLSLNVK